MVPFLVSELLGGHRDLHLPHQDPPVPGFAVVPGEQPEDGVADAGLQPDKDGALRRRRRHRRGDGGAFQAGEVPPDAFARAAGDPDRHPDGVRQGDLRHRRQAHGARRRQAADRLRALDGRRACLANAALRRGGGVAAGIHPEHIQPPAARADQNPADGHQRHIHLHLPVPRLLRRGRRGAVLGDQQPVLDPGAALRKPRHPPEKARGLPCPPAFAGRAEEIRGGA